MNSICIWSRPVNSVQNCYSHVKLHILHDFCQHHDNTVGKQHGMLPLCQNHTNHCPDQWHFWITRRLVTRCGRFPSIQHGYTADASYGNITVSCSAIHRMAVVQGQLRSRSHSGLCKLKGNGFPDSTETIVVWLFFLLVPFTTLSFWTALPMPFRGVLAI